MKHLVDCSNPALCRALLRAGIDDRLPPAGMANALMALGLTTGVALLPTALFAWIKNPTLKLGTGMLAAGIYLSPPWKEQQTPPPIDKNSTITTTELRIELNKNNVEEPVIPSGPHRIEIKRATQRKFNRSGIESQVRERIPAIVPVTPRALRGRSLKGEIALIDRLRLEVDNDTLQFEALLLRYTGLYPNGQLKLEAERLTTMRLEHF